LAHETGSEKLVMPFLSTAYYRFPLEEAIQIAREEASRAGINTVFLAATPTLYALSRKPYRKPGIVSYIS